MTPYRVNAEEKIFPICKDCNDTGVLKIGKYISPKEYHYCCCLKGEQERHLHLLLNILFTLIIIIIVSLIAWLIYYGT
jgi:hypothetical protein